MNKKNSSRAEKVRQRRAKIKAKEAEKTIANRVIKPIAPIRSPEKKSFIGAKKRKVNIKQYEANVLNTVADGLLPVPSIALPKIHFEWRAASAALAIILSVVLYLLFTLPQFMISTPQISGNQYLSTETLNKTLKLDGKTIFTLIPINLERELLLTHPGLADVEITLSLPNTARVTVTERQPALIWQQDGKSAWVDVEGIAFRTTGHLDGLITVSALGSPPAPVVDTSILPEQSKLAPPPYIASETVIALQSLVAHVPPGTPIIYDPKAGLGWTDPRGWTVQMGDITEEMALKLRLYETIVAWFETNHIVPILVNLEHPHTPYYRLEQ